MGVEHRKILRPEQFGDIADVSDEGIVDAQGQLQLSGTRQRAHPFLGVQGHEGDDQAGREERRLLPEEPGESPALPVKAPEGPIVQQQ